jgi:hypothetical protein
LVLILRQHIDWKTISGFLRGNRMKRFLLATVLFLAGATSHAFVVDFAPGDNTNAIGVRNLDIIVNGVTTAYDITFTEDSSHTAPDAGDIFAMSLDPLGGAYSEATRDLDAKAASNAIAAAFNSALTVQTVGLSRKSSYVAPWLYNDKGCQQGAGSGTCGWRGVDASGGLWGSIGAELESNSIVEVARFTACAPNCSNAVVPVPAAVWFFGSGLAVLGWIRRRNTLTAEASA